MNQKPNDLEDTEVSSPAQDNAGQTAPESAGDAGGEAQRDPSDVIAALAAENAELKDRALRALAEAENMRRRAQKEVADAKAYGITGFARDMLTVLDNIGRALEAVPEAERGGLDERMRGLVEGIELTRRDMLKTLERHDVKLVAPLGERFDPNLHQAMFEAEDPSVPTGTVVQVLQAGFTIGGRVLRPALVGVSKGGPRATAPESQAGQA
ncbi:nucleotide exchange factor GrpE [Camelimonas abortus]|uniref:Protein GrpE n=1 Tax=Camelimonas abortus TaxID=1017184 RepID=A0ABV7LCK1_9HYPH